MKRKKSSVLCLLLLILLSFPTRQYSIEPLMYQKNQIDPIYHQINQLKRDFNNLQQEIQNHYQELDYLESLISFIQNTNPTVPANIAYRIVLACHIEAQKYNLDPFLLLALIHQESRFYKDAAGSYGEIGLMQLMPSTAREMATSMDMQEYNLLRIEENIKIGTRYLIYCLNRTIHFASCSQQNVGYGLAAYNQGITSVLSILRKGRKPNNHYSSQVLATYQNIINQQERHPLCSSNFLGKKLIDSSI